MFEQLDYIREEGRFKWNDKVNTKRRNLVGMYCGTIQKVMGGTSSRRIVVNKKSYNEGTIVWFMEYGNLPKRIFYRDKNPLNNHISNIMITKSDRIKEDGIVCSTCESLLAINLFSSSLLKKHKYVCKPCVKIKNLANYATNKETILHRKSQLRNELCHYDHFMRQLEAQEQE